MTTDAGVSPVAIAALGPISATTTLWRVSGQAMVTVAAKARCSLVHEGELSLLEPEPIVRQDALFGSDPMNGVRRAAELAPQLHATDVTLTGHAHPPAHDVPQLAVRFGVHGAAGALFDKVLHVYGELDARRGMMKPVERTPLTYASAYGGIGFGENPLGTGFGGEGERPPRVVEPRDPRRVACFAPIPAAFPVRRKLLGKSGRIPVAGGMLDLPDDFEWSYFQAAPSDQRLTGLRGGEWLVLEGLLPDRPRLCTRVPAWGIAARVYEAQTVGAPELVPLRLDMLHVDADELSCTLVFRGSFPVHTVSELGKIAIATAIAVPGAPIPWPGSAAELPLDLRPATAGAAIDGGPGASASLGFADSLAMTRQILQAAAPAVAPYRPPPIKALEAHPFEGTTTLDPERLASVGAALPFAPLHGSRNEKPATAKKPVMPWVAQASSPQLSEAELAGLARTVDGSAVANEARQRELAAARERLLAVDAAEQAEREQRRVADARAAAEAAETSRLEAEARRAADAEKFRREQEAAARAVKQRAAEKAHEKSEGARQIKTSLYGDFSPKR